MAHLLELDVVVGVPVPGDDALEELGGGDARRAAGRDELA